MEKIVESLLANFANYLVGFLFAYLNYQIKQMQDDRKMKAEIEAKSRIRQEKVILWLLREELDEKIQEQLKNGGITAKDRATIEDGFSLYEEMGGNGEIKVNMDIIRKLPHRKE